MMLWELQTRQLTSAGQFMRNINGHAVGIEEGDTVLYSDFEDDGEMWSGTGPRSIRDEVTFSQSYV